MTGLMGAHATITRALSAELVARHGLTLNDYATLLLLWRAGDEGMRRIDLAVQLQLSPSGITRLLDRLESADYVAKGECKTDARVSYAILTDAGLEKLRECRPGHIADIEARFGADLSQDELRTLADLLSRLSDTSGGEDCGPLE
jgi:DNA-binding MarR family transcriptional regulator